MNLISVLLMTVIGIGAQIMTRKSTFGFVVYFGLQSLMAPILYLKIFQNQIMMCGHLIINELECAPTDRCAHIS